MWETANRAGLTTANLMWFVLDHVVMNIVLITLFRPGPPATTSGAAPTYFIPWRNKVSLDDKLGQIMKWIDLPLAERPQLLMGMEMIHGNDRAVY
jgi:hypothetical protein